MLLPFLAYVPSTLLKPFSRAKALRQRLLLPVVWLLVGAEQAELESTRQKAAAAAGFSFER